MRTIIASGTVVTAEGSQAADVVIEDDTIVEVGRDLSAGGGFDRVVDATNRWVIPGAVDAHTHLDLPFAGTHSKDDFASGSRAAAFGGTTTLLDFAVQPKGGTLQDGLDEWKAKADGKTAIDYGFHMIIREVSEETLGEIPRLVGQGVPDFKIYTAYPGVYYTDDGAIYRALRRAGPAGALVLFHAENGLAIDAITAEVAASGRLDPAAYGISRPPELEGEATHRLIELANLAGTPIYFVHLTSRQALEAVRSARDKAWPIYAETCPQYLVLTIDDLGHGFEGAKYVCTPPLRTPDHVAELWTGLVSRDIQVISTDHCSFDFRGQKELGRDDFRKIPNGLPGIEDRVDIIHDAGVVTGRISRERWVELMSTGPARLFGLYPRKGAIAVGSDADIVVYDPSAERTVSAATHHMAVDYSCYEGWRIRGRSDVVMLRGEILVDHGTFVGSERGGRFLARSAFKPH